MLHHLRMEDKEFRMWNEACDYAINPLLKDSGFILPGDALMDPRFSNLNAEAIYKTLYDEREKKRQEEQRQQQGAGSSGGDQSPEQDNEDNPEDEDEQDSDGDNEDNDSGEDSEDSQDNEDGDQQDGGQNEENEEQEDGEQDGSGGGEEEQEDQSQQPEEDPGGASQWGEVEPSGLTEDEEEEAAANMKQLLVTAMNAAQSQGQGSAAIQAMIKELIEPKIPWREVLERFIAEVSNNDYTWTKPSPRYIPAGLYLPKLESLEIGKVVFIIDTSGSVNETILQTFASELREASSIFKFPVTVIHADDRVELVEELEPEGTINPVGRGGTDFAPAINYVAENIPEAKAIIYLTDGWCWSFAPEPDCPVLWVKYGSYRSFQPPYGEVINID